MTNVLGLRGVALITILVSAVGSLGFMLYAGRRQSSLVLIGLFTVWVLAPFVALVYAHTVAKRWPQLMQARLYGMMLVLTLGSLSIYGYVALGPPRPQPAFYFLVIPLALWLLIVVAALISQKLSRS